VFNVSQQMTSKEKREKIMRYEAIGRKSARSGGTKFQRI